MVCLSSHFPTMSDIKNQSYDDLALFYHFIYNDMQVCIQCTSRKKFAVMCFKFMPFNYSKFNYRADDWYTTDLVDTLDEARGIYLKYVTQIIFESEYYKKSCFV